MLEHFGGCWSLQGDAGTSREMLEHLGCCAIWGGIALFGDAVLCG